MENKNILQTSYFVTGETGVGKTYWAREMYKKAQIEWDKTRDFQSLTTRQAIVFESYPDLCIKTRVYKNLDDIMQSMKIARFLVLDDFWGSPVTGFDPIAYVIINYRLEAGKATIVTTNMSLDDIRKIDDRVASRLHTYVPVIMKGEDQRKPASKPIILTAKHEKMEKRNN